MVDAETEMQIRQRMIQIQEGGEDMAAIYRYVRASGVRRLVKELGKRCGADFLNMVDRHVYATVCRACAVHNGSKKTLDSTVFNFTKKEI